MQAWAELVPAAVWLCLLRSMPAQLALHMQSMTNMYIDPECMPAQLEFMPALQVAIALGLLTAEVSAPPFNQLVCTFSEEPQLHHIKEGSLVDKVGWQGLGLSTEPA